MKTIKIIFAALILSGLSVKAQINLVGAGSGTNGTIDIVKWQALDSTSINRYPSGLAGYLFASSVFNAYNSNYYLGGIAAGSGVLLAFNTNSNTSNLTPYANLSNVSEIDMSTGKIYKLSTDSVGYIAVSEYDIATNSQIVLGVINEPGVYGIIADAIGFDSNNGILYYVGFDTTAASCLYGISVRNPVFSWTKTTLLTTAPGNNFNSVNYDNVNNLLFASNAEFNSNGNYIGNKVVEINTTSGEIINRGALTGFPYYLGGSASFDQNTGSFLLVAFDTAFNQKMIVFNTLNNTFVTGFVPSNVSEIVCDNYSFAKSAYTGTSINEQDKLDFSIFPNPATNKFTMNIGQLTSNCTLKIHTLTGQECLSMQIQQPETEIPIQSLAKGVYMVTIQHEKGTKTKKLITQ